MIKKLKKCSESKSKPGVPTPLWRALLLEHRLPWRYKQKLILILFYSFHNWIVKIKFLIKKPKLKVVISTHLFGGIGGTERLSKSIIESMPDYEFHVFAKVIIKQRIYTYFKNYYLNKPLDKNKSYDIYINLNCHYPGGIEDLSHFKKKVIVPTGAPVFEKEQLFDYVFLDANNRKNFCSKNVKTKIAVSDITITYPKTFKKVKNLPSKFLLTVFNHYGKIKGSEVLYEVAKYSKLPIIWCWNNATAENLKVISNLKNVIQLPNLSQEELYYLYTKASGYISFSLSEGFGFAIADAFMFDLPIISRNIGIVTLINKQKGVHIYNNEKELKEYLNKTKFIKPHYDKSILNKFNYKKQINKILNEKYKSLGGKVKL